MLSAAVRYARGLDLDERALSDCTGIAKGWVMGTDSYRCGCWVCEIVVEQPKGLFAADAVADAALLAFLEIAEQRGCLHWNKYKLYQTGHGDAYDVLIAKNTMKRADARAASKLLPEAEFDDFEDDEEDDADLELPMPPEVQETSEGLPE